MSDKAVTIVLVEDDDIDAEGLNRAFKKNRIANPIVRAKDGVEALGLLRAEEGFETIKGPIILLVDLNMPRMNGIELITEIRKDSELKKLIVFVLTTSESDEDRFKAYDLNVAGHVIKENVGKDFLDMISMIDHFWKIIEFP